jgi:uncharacterized protein YeaO (DUF488 family)
MPPSFDRHILSPQIHFCRAHDIRAATSTDNVARLLVDRLRLRRIAKSNPSLDTLLRFANRSRSLSARFCHYPAKWDEFTRLHRTELAATPKPLSEALEWCREGAVTLIYAVHDNEKTHALMLRDVLMETPAHEARRG